MFVRKETSMERIKCILLVFIIVMASNLTVFANDVKSSTSALTINEYDFLLNLTEKSNSELVNIGYTANDIDSIRSLRESYTDHINEYTDLSTEALTNLGYTQQQIFTLRNFNGTEEQIRSLAATLNLTLEIDYVTWSSSENRTNSRLCFDFEWNGVPLIKWTDVVALSWNNWTINGKVGYVTYTDIYGSGNDYLMSATYISNSGPTSYGAGYKFAMAQNDNQYWAKTGYGIFTLYHNYERADLSAYAEYGHSTLSVSPTFSIPGYGSISFSDSTEMQDQAWANMEC